LQILPSLRRVWRLQLWLLRFVGSLPVRLLAIVAAAARPMF
jgi:hypothetical protein